MIHPYKLVSDIMSGTTSNYNNDYIQAGLLSDGPVCLSTVGHKTPSILT